MNTAPTRDERLLSCLNAALDRALNIRERSKDKTYDDCDRRWASANTLACFLVDAIALVKESK